MTVETTGTERLPRTGRSRLRRGAAAGTALTIGLAGSALLGSSAQAVDPAPTTVQLTVWTGGAAPDWGSNGELDGSGRRQLSDDGRYAVFATSGPILSGQERLSWQIALRDRHLGTTTLVSRGVGGAPGNGGSGYPSISADGRVVAFHSYASDLVPGDTNGTSDLFVHDVATGTTSRISVTGTGAQVPRVGPGTNVVGHPTISADGRWVGFEARAAGYTADDGADGGVEAYLHDRQTGQNEVVSRTTGAPVGAMPGSMVIPSADGNLVAFYSGFHHDDPTVFVRDRAAGSTSMVSSGSEGLSHFHMSSDGRFVVFDSRSGNLPAVAEFAHVFLHDRQTGTTERVSVDSAGTPAEAGSARPVVSDDGRYVAFQSDAANLVAGDTNGSTDVFRHDRSTGQTLRVSVGDGGGQTASYGVQPSISGDGQHVAFIAQGNDLTPVEISGYRQYFVRDLTGRHPALFARIGALPPKLNRDESHRIAAPDVRTGPDLVVTWQPTGKGEAVTRTATVNGEQFDLVAPGKHGSYTVTVSYADQVVGSRTITVLRAKAKKLPKKVKAGKALRVRTVGLGAKQAVTVQFKPKGKKGGKAAKRKARVNAKGVAKVKAPPRRGKYQVVVRGAGTVLRKSTLTVR